MIYNEIIVIEGEIRIDNKIGLSIACGIDLGSSAGCYEPEKLPQDTRLSDTLIRGNDNGRKEESEFEQDRRNLDRGTPGAGT
jgi:hypothetical protein